MDSLNNLHTTEVDYKLYVTVSADNIREKTKPWGQKYCLQESGEDCKNISANVKVLKSTVTSIILKWKNKPSDNSHSGWTPEML